MNIFILLIGFPGVGKLAIAKELSPLVPAKIIDNHWFNNPILRLLDDGGTSPLPEGIWEYTGRVRQAVLDAIVAYSAPSANFIFTHVPGRFFADGAVCRKRQGIETRQYRKGRKLRRPGAEFLQEAERRILSW